MLPLLYYHAKISTQSGSICNLLGTMHWCPLQRSVKDCPCPSCPWKFLPLSWSLMMCLPPTLYYFFFSVLFIYLRYNIVLVLPYIDMNPPWVYMCSPSWNPLPAPSPSHPSGSSQCTSPEHPVSCIEPGLAIHFPCDNLHVSMPFSHIIPPSPSPTESKRLFYTSVSLLLSHI